jgi:peptidoglycan/LPS O-acetylase OafA/YrhL
MKQHLTQLDALRGVAALAVFFSHCKLMLRDEPQWAGVVSQTPLNIVWDGGGAVMLFFVLSGFVLNLRYANAADLPSGWWLTFVKKRILRLYPAFIVVILGAMAARHFIGATDLFSSHFAHFWSGRLGWNQALRTLSLVGPRIDMWSWDAPIWSLVVEMRVSLIFPLIILWLHIPGGRRDNWWALLPITLICGGLYEWTTSEFFMYLPLFFLWATMAKHLPDLSRVYADLPKWPLLILGAVLYESYAMAVNAGCDSPLPYFLVHQLCGIGAAILILACVCSWRLKILFDSAPLQFMGKTSYSFYLVHLPILLSIAPVMAKSDAPIWVIWACALILSYTAAGVLHRWVEVPFMGSGHRWPSSKLRILEAEGRPDSPSTPSPLLRA